MFCFITIICTCIPIQIMFRLILGDGSDEHPFILSMSSKSLLSVLLTVSTCLLHSVFHMDSTFKSYENEFLVIL